MLGINGSGKSTLLRIMAGLDKEFDGEARPQAGIKIGYLPQEPELDLEKNVRQNVEIGVSEIQSLLTRFDEISMRFGEELSEDEMNALLEEQGPSFKKSFVLWFGLPSTPKLNNNDKEIY